MTREATGPPAGRRPLPPAPIDPDDARHALRRGTGGGVKIAVLDSGIEAGHPDLCGLALTDDVVLEQQGGYLVATPGRGEDPFGHGTAVASIIRRTAPGAAVGSFAVLKEDESTRALVMREAARMAIGRGYQILNCSFGCPGHKENVLQYKAWVDEAYLAGVHVVAACSNANIWEPEWPGHFPTVITVTTARTQSTELFYSPECLVEFAAAGVQVPAAWRGGTRKRVTGSSVAAPVVAALLARLLSIYPGLPPLEAKALLHRIAEPVPTHGPG